MARMLDDEFYNVQRNILDKVTDKSVDNDALKGVVAMFGLDVFKRLIDRKQNVMDGNIQQLQTDGTVRNGRNEELWKRRNKVLEDDKKIKLDGENSFYDGQAESIFMNPKTHADSTITFNPNEFKDSNSPMYKVKEEWKQKYISDVLLPQHNNKYEQINKDILTFDEYNKDNRELTRHAIEYAKRPSERSIIRQWNLFGKGRTAKLKNNYEVAKTQTENMELEREGYLIHNRPLINAINPETGDTFGSTLKGSERYYNPANELLVKPFSALTKEMYSKGEVYSKFEFTQRAEYKSLSSSGKILAIKEFDNNEAYNDPNNSYQLLNIFETVGLLESENKKMITYNRIKYNDSDFIENKPKRIRKENEETYKNREDYKTWQSTVDEAYKDGSLKKIQARKEAGYDVTMREGLQITIEESAEYFVEIREFKRQNDLPESDEKYLSDEDYAGKVEEFKIKTLQKLMENELGIVDIKEDFIYKTQRKRAGEFLDTLTTEKGQALMKDWFRTENKKRKIDNRKLIPSSEMKTSYTIAQFGGIIDDSALLESILQVEDGLIGISGETEAGKEYRMSKDLLE